jgi:outer membrane protein assembly factor BamB
MIAMVSAGGRLFYIFDEGLTGVTPKFLPEKWTLTSRDAFNGVLLWKRAFENFRGDRWNNSSLRGVPGWLRRLLVAEGDRLFLPVGLGSPVSILDAATGEVLATCDGTEAVQELRCLDGTLLVQIPQELLAFDAANGRRRWQAKARPRPSTLAAQAGRVFFLEGPEAVCLDLNSGKPLWRNQGEPPKQGQRGASLLVARAERVLVADGGRLTALAADSGEQLWSAAASLAGRGELFVAQGHAWHWQGEEFVGHDLATGQVKTTVNADAVFTPGHHLRCYQSKATDNYIITPYRGVEFVSITGRQHSQHDWIRGSCTYGVMPANGLLYVPPHPCFCYPGVKLTGLNALAPAAEEEGERGRGGEGERLEKGPAFGQIRNPKPEIRNEDDWPMYRHDARRTGATDCEVPAELAPKWDVKLGGPLTPPVAAGSRVYVAQKDAGLLFALDAADGHTAWEFIAGGPIDSPPSVLGALVLFGSADGCVYCLRAADGVLAWRFRAAPSERRIVSHGRLESPWRVHGSVLLHDGVVYCTAGRSSYLDGGIRLFALDPTTGEVLHQTTLDTWARTREDAVGKPFVPAYHMEGSSSDVLVCENDSIYMGQYKLDTSLAEQPCPYVIPVKGEDGKPVAMDLTGKPFVSRDVQKTQPLEEHQRQWLENAARGLVAELREKHGAFNIGHRHMGRHVLANFGLLDDSWFNRTFWMYSETWPGFYLGHRGAKSGQLLVVGAEKTYAVQAYPYRNMQSPLFTPGETGYLLLADTNDNEPLLDYHTRETTKGWGFTRAAPPVWHEWVPVRIRAMTLAGDRLFIAGPPDAVDLADPMAPFEGRKGGVLRAVSPADGKTLSEVRLPAPPVFDGLIATPGRLLLSTTDGRVVCLGSKP